MSRPSALRTSAGRMVRVSALFEAVDDDANVEFAEVLRIEAAAAGVFARLRPATRQFGDQQHQVRPRDQRQRPVRPVRRKVDEDRAEFARRKVDDASRWSLGMPSSGIISGGAAMTLSPLAMIGAWSRAARSPSSRAPASSRSRSDSFGRRPSWNATSPNCTSRSIRQASRPCAASCCAKRIASWVIKRRRANAADALDHADELAVARFRDALPTCAISSRERRERGLEIVDAERQAERRRAHRHRTSARTSASGGS